MFNILHNHFNSLPYVSEYFTIIVINSRGSDVIVVIFNLNSPGGQSIFPNMLEKMQKTPGFVFFAEIFVINTTPAVDSPAVRPPIADITTQGSRIFLYLYPRLLQLMGFV